MDAIIEEKVKVLPFTDENLRRQWIIATKRKDWEPTKYSKICSAHFREADIDRTSLSCVRIRKGAVPAIFTAFPVESQIKERRPLKRKLDEPSSTRRYFELERTQHQ
ncbi:hypothetical protein J6590_093535 [Homalodisca vitripennis]|nr:hypothetical protein J6590_093535 [Homalodisca vitripennis]